LKLTEDAKVIYTTLGKLAGINVVFDPDFKPSHISVELVKVTLEEALQIVEMESKSFVRPVTKNTIYVAADTPTKRKEIEQNVMKTFYLSNVGQASDLTDIATTIRSTLDLTRITPMPSQGALIVRGTPDQLTLVQKLIDDMDKARPEVIVEVLVMQVTRERIRDLGIQPPTSATLSFLGVSTSNSSSSTSTGSSSSTVSLNDLRNLSATDFAVTIPQVTANALFSDSQSKLIQNPQIRALDGQRASLRIGQRYPIATGSFSSTSGISPLVNTQFQYIDVGVNIDITPRVHADNDVTLKLVLDITAVDSMTTIGGISQPVIGQRKIEHEIRLKDGEINLLGGMLEEADTKSLSGLPWLSNIPLLRYFFSSEQTDKRQNELVFVLIPHIVRGQELNDANYKELDVGTSNTIELRHLEQPEPSGNPATSVTTSASEPTPAVPARDVPNPSTALARFGLSAQKSTDTVPNGGYEAPANSVLSLNPTVAFKAAPAASISLGLSSPQSAPIVGETFMVDVLIDGAQNLLSLPLDVKYDASKIQLLSVNQGTLTARGERPVLNNSDDPVTGIARITATLPPRTGGVSGRGTLVTLSFSARAPGQAIIDITGVSIKDETNHSVPASSTKTTIDIRSKV
jgi:general secretion pathway protein D